MTDTYRSTKHQIAQHCGYHDPVCTQNSGVLNRVNKTRGIWRSLSE